MSLRSMLGKNLVSTGSSPKTEKSNSSLNTKMLSQDILETAKTSQLRRGHVHKNRKKGEGIVREKSPLKLEIILSLYFL
jgi:hypothetical protein